MSAFFTSPPLQSPLCSCRDGNLKQSYSIELRPSPPLLLIFFHDKGWLQPNLKPSSTHSRTRSLSTKAPSTSSTFEFLLFSYLLRFIHEEGTVGDSARAGLLSLFAIAFPSGAISSPTLVYDDPLLDARRALAGYILDGDFVDVMAAGLGAVWSLLPSKLRVPTLGENIGSQNGEEGVSTGGMVLGADLSEPRDGEDDIRLSTDESVRNQIGMLVKLFGFLQDTEDPNRHFNDTTPNADHEYEPESDDSDPDAELSILSIWIRVGEASLNAIQSSFLENVLYPSILECSPTDGSSVAIMTYLDILLSNMDDGVLL